MSTLARAERSRWRLRPVVRVVVGLVLAALSGLIVVNVVPYFRLGALHPFFLEKARVFEDAAWRIAFHAHIVGGCVCLLSALPQLSRTLLRRRPGWHRAFGWTYVASVLGLVVPTGLYLAVFAKGGLAGRFGFLLLGVAFLYTTWRGLERVRARDFRGHVPWMLRSYALAATAISFRVLYLGLYLAGASDPYVAGIWLSLVVNVAIVELVVRRHHPKGAPA